MFRKIKKHAAQIALIVVVLVAIFFVNLGSPEQMKAELPWVTEDYYDWTGTCASFCASKGGSAVGVGVIVNEEQPAYCENLYFVFNPGPGTIDDQECESWCVNSCDSFGLYETTTMCRCSCPACTDTTWTPATDTVCEGESFTQTSNCGTTRSATGTKSCGCVAKDYYDWTGTCASFCASKGGSAVGVGANTCFADFSDCNTSAQTCPCTNSHDYFFDGEVNQDECDGDCECNGDPEDPDNIECVGSTFTMCRCSCP